MGRLLLAIFVGVVVNGLLVFGVELLNTLVHPLPAGLNPQNVQQVRTYIESGAVPITSLLMVLLAYAAGAFGGGFVASKLAPRRGLMPALVIGQISLVFVIVNLIQFPHQIWFMLVSVLIPIPAAWAGGKAAHARGGMK